MNSYYEKDGYMVGICSDGTEFIFDKEKYDIVSQWNWMHHNKSIDGARGKDRISLAKLVTGYRGRHPIHLRQKGFDFRLSNLFADNVYTDMGDYYSVETISGVCFYIDKEDEPRVHKYVWYLNSQGYPEVRDHGKVIRLHRYIMNMDEPFTYDRVVDHIDRNPLNNRKSNLRIVSQAVNTRNRAMSGNNTSGVPGVFWSSEMGAWRAYRVIDGVRHNIGNFETIEDAEAAVQNFEQCMRDGREYVSCSTHDNRLTSASGHKYIYKRKSRGYTVSVNGHYLGLRNTLEEAQLLRDQYLNQQ
nr:MAG TPA: homing endonuclease [Caudoviricetes sp.]